MAYQTELLLKIYPSNRIDDLKGYQCKILHKCACSFHTLLTVIAVEHDYYAASTLIRMLTDNLASYNLIYHEKDNDIKLLRHYLFILDGLAQRKKFFCSHELKYDGKISKDEFDALEKQVKSSKDNTFGAIEFCDKAIRQLPIYETQKVNIDFLIDKQNWQFIDISKPKGHYKWELLYEKLCDKNAFTDMAAYLSQFVHGLSLSNLTMDNTPSDFEPLLCFGIKLMGYVLQFIESDFGLRRIDLYNNFFKSHYFFDYFSALSEKNRNEMLSLLRTNKY